MKYAALILALCSCKADRWNASVARGEGTADSPKVGFDTEETTVEVGISGPLWSAPEKRLELPLYPYVPPQPAPVVTPAPAASTDWVALIGASITTIAAALAAVRYTPSRYFQGPFDKKKPEGG